MTIKFLLNGDVFEADLTEQEIEKLKRTKRKTGYERVIEGTTYYDVSSNGNIGVYTENGTAFDRNFYLCANYYSDRVLAENNSRADSLFRRLRRFAVEHSYLELNWQEPEQTKWCIYYNAQDKELQLGEHHIRKAFGQIYFDSEEAAQLALDTFKDELLWYFTEYKDKF